MMSTDMLEGDEPRGGNGILGIAKFVLKIFIKKSDDLELRLPVLKISLYVISSGSAGPWSPETSQVSHICKVKPTLLR